jgi:hypothetical protein
MVHPPKRIPALDFMVRYEPSWLPETGDQEEAETRRSYIFPGEPIAGEVAKAGASASAAVSRKRKESKLMARRVRGSET